MAHAATVVVVRDVQALVQAVFDASKTLPVEFQLLDCIEPLGPSAGEQGHGLGFTPGG
jgi:hypothetical protein